MNETALAETARELVADDKGVLAIDESVETCNRRFAAFDIAQNEENRRRWRELILTVPNLGQSISGVILFDETIRQTSIDGRAFVDILRDAGILIGIKVDTGAKPLAGFAGELITEGLDGLRERLVAYAKMGARFAKWRAVFNAEDGIPSPGCIEANAQALARYAALCQEGGLVPIVEPELLMDGAHDIESCEKMCQAILQTVFAQLASQRVVLEGIILKPSMVLPGTSCADGPSDEQVAVATTRCLMRSVPAAVPGIAFLSGGQSAEEASARLNALNTRSRPARPWALAFSYGRAIQQPALAIWRGEEANVRLAQTSLLHHARSNRAARRGEYCVSSVSPAA